MKEEREEEMMRQFLDVFCDVMDLSFSEHGFSRQNQITILTLLSESLSNVLCVQHSDNVPYP